MFLSFLPWLMVLASTGHCSSSPGEPVDTIILSINISSRRAIQVSTFICRNGSLSGSGYGTKDPDIIGSANTGTPYYLPSTTLSLLSFTFTSLGPTPSKMTPSFEVIPSTNNGSVLIPPLSTTISGLDSLKPQMTFGSHTSTPSPSVPVLNQQSTRQESTNTHSSGTLVRLSSSTLTSTYRGPLSRPFVSIGLGTNSSSSNTVNSDSRSGSDSVDLRPQFLKTVPVMSDTFSTFNSPPSAGPGVKPDISTPSSTATNSGIFLPDPDPTFISAAAYTKSSSTPSTVKILTDGSLTSSVIFIPTIYPAYSSLSATTTAQTTDSGGHEVPIVMSLVGKARVVSSMAAIKIEDSNGPSQSHFPSSLHLAFLTVGATEAVMPMMMIRIPTLVGILIKTPPRASRINQ